MSGGRVFPSLKQLSTIVIHTVKGFGIVNKVKVEGFLELSCFFNDPGDVGNLISGSSPFSKMSLNIWKFTVHVLLKPGLENFEWLQPWNLKFAPRKKSFDQPREHIRKQRHYFADKGPYSQSYGFSSTHVWMWEFDHKEGWAPKYWCLQTVCWRRLLRVPWTARRSNNLS